MRCWSRVLLATILALLFAAGANSQQTNESRFILRAPAASVPDICQRYGLKLVSQLGRSDVFLVKSSYSDPARLNAMLQQDPEVRHSELEGSSTISEASLSSALNQSTAPILEALVDLRIVTFFGAKVWVGYVQQPAAELIRAPEMRELRVAGTGIVAIIDTGVDPNHPVLKQWLASGYDFTREVSGSGSEWPDLDPSTTAILQQSTAPILEHPTVISLNQSTAPILEQPAATKLQSSQVPVAFGHGTMVAGLIHLVAPKAKIMPLKAFRADGTARTSDIVRAIYFAVANGAKVINMSFSMDQFSREVMRAINYATRNGVICVAAVGNASQEVLVFPAAQSNVLSIAATSDEDKRASFSNFGADLVKLAAPGEALITTYPGGYYAGVWGTSFSTALVAGAVALLLEVDVKTDQDAAEKALSHAKQISPELGYGRLDLYEAWLHRRKALGLQ